jgi:hypothetical protein
VRSLAADGDAAGRRLGRRRESARQLDFVSRTKLVAGLARVRQLPNKIQDNNGVDFCPEFRNPLPAKSFVVRLRGFRQIQI